MGNYCIPKKKCRRCHLNRCCNNNIIPDQLLWYLLRELIRNKNCRCCQVSPYA